MAEYDQPDPNQEREDVPFPSPMGPPRFPAPQQMAMAPQQAPHGGNGHYAPHVQQAPQAVMERRPQAAAPQPGPTIAQQRLQVMRIAAEIGAIQVAQIWAQHIASLQADYQQKTGQLIRESEVFALIADLLTPVLDG